MPGVYDLARGNKHQSGLSYRLHYRGTCVPACTVVVGRLVANSIAWLALVRVPTEKLIRGNSERAQIHCMYRIPRVVQLEY